MDLIQHNTASGAPDPAQIDRSQCLDRAFPVVAGRRPRSFCTVACQSAMNAIYAHAHASSDIEVCGILVGSLCLDRHGPFLCIEGSIAGLHAQQFAARVTFTSDTWTHFHEVLDRDFPGRRIVGWYHTHPGYGIFLSGMDLFIHRSFFDLPWQVALVYDPLGGDEGLFQWNAGNVAQSPMLIYDNAISTRPRIDQRVRRPAPEEEADDALAAQRPIDRIRRWFARK